MIIYEKVYRNYISIKTKKKEINFLYIFCSTTRNFPPKYFCSKCPKKRNLNLWNLHNSDVTNNNALFILILFYWFFHGLWFFFFLGSYGVLRNSPNFPKNRRSKKEKQKKKNLSSGKSSHGVVNESTQPPRHRRPLDLDSLRHRKALQDLLRLLLLLLPQRAFFFLSPIPFLFFRIRHSFHRDRPTQRRRFHRGGRARRGSLPATPSPSSHHLLNDVVRSQLSPRSHQGHSQRRRGSAFRRRKWSSRCRHYVFGFVAVLEPVRLSIFVSVWGWQWRGGGP